MKPNSLTRIRQFAVHELNQRLFRCQCRRFVLSLPFSVCHLVVFFRLSEEYEVSYSDLES